MYKSLMGNIRGRGVSFYRGIHSPVVLPRFRASRRPKLASAAFASWVCTTIADTKSLHDPRYLVMVLWYTKVMQDFVYEQ